MMNIFYLMLLIPAIFLAWICFYTIAIVILDEEEQYPGWLKRILRIK